LLAFLAVLLISCGDNGTGSNSERIQITGIQPDSGTVGTRVTIRSGAVNPRPENNHVAFNGTPAKVLSVTKRSIIVRVPEGATSGPVSFKVGGYSTKGPNFTVLTRGPVIKSVSPEEGGPGARVTITGKHFLPFSLREKILGDSTLQTVELRAGLDSIPVLSSGIDSLDSHEKKTSDSSPSAQKTARINGGIVSVSFGKTLAPIVSLSDTKLIVEVPDEATQSKITVTVGDQSATSSDFRLLASPVISAVSPKQGPEGTKVTITGKNFGLTKSDNTVTFNGTKAGVQSASETKLVVKVPKDAMTGSVKVKTNGQTAEGATFTVTETAAPQVKITSVKPKKGSIGTKVTIKGKNFASKKSSNTVTFNGTKATVKSASSTKLEVAVPKGASTGNVKVKAGGQTATGPTFTVISDPSKQLTVTSVSPKKGPVGTKVTIKGKNFSSSKSRNTVTFNGTKASVQSASAVKLIVKVPQGATNGPVKVKTGGQAAAGASFTVTADPDEKLSIDDITPKSGPIGTSVSITGRNFGGKKSGNTVTFNGKKASVRKASTTKLTVKVPKGATSGSVKVKVGDQTAAGPTFTVTKKSPPQVKITSVTPKKGPVGTKVTIQGKHFTPKKLDNTVTFNGTKADIQSATKTKLVVKVPRDATTGPIKVKANSQTAEGPTFTVTEKSLPEVEITGISPKKGPEGTKVTIQGKNFSSKKSKNEVTFNGTKATVKNASSTKLKVTVPKGATDGNVKVKTGGQTATGPTFTVTKKSPPQVSITSISPKKGPEGTSVTITGKNFSADTSKNTVTFNGTKARILSTSKTKLVVTVPRKATSGPVKVKVGSQTATGPDFNITINHAPVIISDATYMIDENKTDAGTVKATDPDGDDLTYSIDGGADADEFTIDGSLGKLTFKTAPDYEALPGEGDANNDNVYEVTVKVSDGDKSDTQEVKVKVQNVAEAPKLARGRIWLNNEDTYYAYNPNFIFDAVPAGTDLVNDVYQFTISFDMNTDLITNVTIGGPDASLFSVVDIEPEGYGIDLSGPTIDYNHSTGGKQHQYQFSVIAKNDAGQTTTETFTIPVQSPFAGGSGTSSDPYQVANLQQLQLVGQFLDAHFVQVADIDASPTVGWNGGEGFESIGNSSSPFTGSYDGNGHTITGLTINRPSTDQVGLFSFTGSSAALTLVQLKDVAIKGSSWVGALVGFNNGIIQHSYAMGSVSGTSTGGGGSVQVGGLIGFNRGIIQGSYATVNVTAGSELGGLVGENDFDGTITNSYATGSVTGDDSGGLVGYNKGTIQYSYATGSVSGDSAIGGLVGHNYRSGTVITDSYWDTQTSGQSSSAGGTGLTTSQMQGTAAKNNMAGFDFSGVWKTVTNPDDYPILRGVGGQP
jgi:hypothetical protein